MSQNTLWQIEDIKFTLNEFSSLVQWNGNQDEKVLHYGINSGFILSKFLMPHLPTNVKELVCVDCDDAKVDTALRHYNHDKIQFKRTDMNDGNFEKFHHIFSFYCIDQPLRQKNLFTHLYKHLTPNGDVFLISLYRHGFDYFHEHTNTNGNHEDNQICQQIKFDTIKSLKRMMLEIGFGDLICEYYDRYQIFPNVTILKKSLKAYMNERNLPKDIIEENINNLLTNQIEVGAMKFMGKNRKIIAVPYTMIFVYAKRIVKLNSK